MKRTLLTLALITAAGTAGAQTANPPTVGGGAVNPPSVGGGSVTTPSVNPPSAETPSVPSKSVGAGGAQATTPPAGSGSVTPPSMSSGGATTPGVNPPSASTPSIDTANAPNDPAAMSIKKKIEADGYKNVQGLAKGSDGLWHGRALRGSAEVQVTVDARGNISAQ